MAEKTFLQNLGGFVGGMGGFIVSVPTMIVSGAIELVKSEGDWDKAMEKASKDGESCIEGGVEIGETTSPIIGAVVSGLIAGAINHEIYKPNDKKKGA